MLTGLKTLRIFTGRGSDDVDDDAELGLTEMCPQVSCLTNLTTLSVVDQWHLDDLPVELFTLQRWGFHLRPRN